MTSPHRFRRLLIKLLKRLGVSWIWSSADYPEGAPGLPASISAPIWLSFPEWAPHRMFAWELDFYEWLLDGETKDGR